MPEFNLRSITWEDIIKEQPSLLALYNEILSIKVPKRKAENLWYHTFKPQMLNLVGFRTEGSELIRSTEAYDLVYRKLYNALNKLKR